MTVQVTIRRNRTKKPTCKRGTNGRSFEVRSIVAVSILVAAIFPNIV